MRRRRPAKAMLVLVVAGLLLSTVKLHTVLGSLEPWQIEWSKIYAGSDYDNASCLISTNDGGYALAGFTRSYGSGDADFWLIKTDSKGNVQWNRTYGGTAWDVATSIIQMNDSGYLLAGYTDSFENPYELWLVNTDALGNALWNKTFGAWCFGGVSLFHTSDGGFAVATSKPAILATNVVDDFDFWLLKFDSLGTEQWDKTYGITKPLDGEGANGLYWDWVYSAIQTDDDGYLLGGVTNQSTAWLIKIDETGSASWNSTYFEGGSSYIGSLVQASTGGYAFVCSANTNGGSSLVKIDSSGNITWMHDYGDSIWSIGGDLIQTSDGGYAFAGTIMLNDTGDFWLVKTDVGGIIQWNATYPGEGWDEAFSIVQTYDGDYTLAGCTAYWSDYGVVPHALLVKILAPERPDINHDGVADIYDAILLANAYDSRPTNHNWNPNADINNNGIVDIYDAIILASHYNQHYP